MKFKLLRNAFFFLSFALASFAAPAEVIPKGVFFRTIGVGVNATDLLYLDGTKPKPITIDTERRSIFYEYKGGTTPLVFVRETIGPDGQKITVPIAEVLLAANQTRALLIFFRQPGENDKINVFALADDAKSVSPGGYRFVNFLPVQSGVILGGKKQIIPPRDSYICEAPVGKDNPTAVYPFKVYIIKGESAIPVYSNVWSADPRKRNLVLITYSPESSTGVEVKYLTESVNAIPVDEVETKPQV